MFIFWFGAVRFHIEIFPEYVKKPMSAKIVQSLVKKLCGKEKKGGEAPENLLQTRTSVWYVFLCGLLPKYPIDSPTPLCSMLSHDTFFVQSC